MMKKKKENLLELIPCLKPHLSLQPAREDEELVCVVIPRTSWIERFSIRFLKQPETIKVKLDELGSFVIRLCDGRHTVDEIQKKLEAAFGEKAEPVLPRLATFLQMVEENGWIRWEKSGEKKGC
ncbi:PqqD family protein [Thermoactinomyces intermedius]|jgi:hypothetical protein|uniref:PqqD family protein n=1 Tax=Thermoactinomyces intermedius TaxID=2024 RepID=A0A8I1AGX1_THEIN|nr:MULTISPECIES: PqqD family protein [Thermoactinomyces]MBA4549226.1 PqqD family protein [Thermoactinomyces intermedius]MBA4836171.1 PqqD family protein [Thermoactinomyces intermedius]MBH8595758.1 PqqD family protein [Thermoactinomyces intermedius]MBH8600830.1 PqqD family protein [Thermoactinomyces sp. CICC 23799]